MPSGDFASVWLVDDDPVFRTVLATQLSNAGYAVTEFSSSLDALARLDAGERVDLLIADLHLANGEPHGLALVGMARMRRRELPCIVITGDDTFEANRISESYPILRKPLNFDEVAAKIGVLLATRRS